jgi:Caspase domain
VTYDRWALLVGASKYEFHPPLRFAAADAIASAEALETSLGFDRRRMLVLADGDGRTDYSPTRRDIFHSLGLLGDPHSDFYAKRELDPIAEDDLFVSYFSGHGIREHGQEFLLTLDTSRYCLADTAMPLEGILGRIAKLPCRHKILFLDACREEFYQDEGARAIGGAKGIGERGLVDREGWATFYSCDPGQRSYEIDDLRHGAFTFCLLEAINNPRINTLGELDAFLKSRVPQENVKANKEPQQPFAVPNPTDMLELDLLRLTQRETDLETLTMMTNELYNRAVLDIDWWEKLCSVWESGDARNLELKQKMFERLCAGTLDFEEFAAKWRRTELYQVTTAAPRVSVPLPGAVTAAVR